MRRVLRQGGVLAAMLVLAACASRDATLLRPDVQGHMHAPLQGQQDDVVVLIFSSPDCPIANAIAPEIERLHLQTVDAGGRFFFVHVRDDVTPRYALGHAKRYGITSHVLLDHDQSLARRMNATVTPEVVVLRFDAEDAPRAVYQGAVNNLYADLGSRRQEATEHYARDGISAAHAGTAVRVPYRTPIGCTIENVR